MKIALVHDALINRGGAERVFQIFCEMFPEASIYTSVYFPEKTFPYFKNRDIKTTILQKFVWNENQYKALFPLANILMQTVKLENFDMILSSSTFCGKYVSSRKAKHICYCYTPFRLFWNPHSYDQDSKLRLRLRLVKPWINLLRKWDFNVAQRIDQFIAMTDKTKILIKNVYNKNSIVIPPPINYSNFKSKNEIGHYFLSVSRLEPYKKIDLVVDVFNKIRLPLKIVGSGSMLSELKKKSENNIEFLQSISDSHLLELYQNCIAVIFPQKEDYGLVPMEANACGKPVICYGKGGVETTMVPYSNENKSHATALFFENQTVESLMLAIKYFEKIEFNQKALVENAKRFDVDIFKNKILSVIENVSQ